MKHVPHPTPPLFPAEFPRYAAAAHLAFWTSSAFLIAGVLGGYAGIVPAQAVLSLFWIAVGSAFLLGAAAMASGFLYVGNQVFDRTPTTGWAARVAGGLVLAGASSLLFLAYGLTQVRGV